MNKIDVMPALNMITERCGFHDSLDILQVWQGVFRDAGDETTATTIGDYIEGMVAAFEGP